MSGFPQNPGERNWIRQVRSTMRIQDWWPLLAAKLRGHYNYYGVSGNSRGIDNFGFAVMQAVAKWLNRRSQCKSFTWSQFNEYLNRHPLPKQRIVHNLYQPSPRK